MATSYIPARDPAYDAWLQNFTVLLTAAPATYGLAAADAVACAAQYTAWHNAYVITTNPTTKSKTTVAAKDNAKAASLALIRPYAQQIANNLGVLDANKLAIGVKVKDSTRTPINPPGTFPIISIIGATNLQHTLRFTDQNAPATSRSKPSGATSLEVHAVPSDTVPVNPDAIPFYGLATKQPYAVNFDSGDVGKQCYYAARWLNSKGQPGPWSNMINFTVASGT